MVDFNWEGSLLLNGSEVRAIYGALLTKIDDLEQEALEQTSALSMLDEGASKTMAINRRDDTFCAIGMRRRIIEKLEKL